MFASMEPPGGCGIKMRTVGSDPESALNAEFANKGLSHKPKTTSIAKQLGKDRPIVNSLVPKGQTLNGAR